MELNFLLIIAASVVVVVAFAVGLRLLLPIVRQHFRGSTASWSRLSEVYATTRQPPKGVFSRQSIVVGQVLYRNCMIVGFDGEGLYLEIGFPMSVFGRRALFVPWTEFKQSEEGRLFWRKASVLTIGEPPVGTITVPMTVFEAIRPSMTKAGERTPELS